MINETQTLIPNYIKKAEGLAKGTEMEKIFCKEDFQKAAEKFISTFRSEDNYSEDEWMTICLHGCQESKLMECRDAIADAIANAYRDNSLNVDAAVNEVLGHAFTKYSVLKVLACSVSPWDGRYSTDNKTWAKEFLGKTKFDVTQIGRYLGLNRSHPGLVDLLISYIRKMP